ncbi:AAA family ATPase (plasmid) [Halorutilales archaeon Cl-col2-1]
MSGLSDSEIEERIQEYRHKTDWDQLKRNANITSEAVRDLAESLVKERQMGEYELTTLYRLCQNTDASSIQNKEERIDNLDIPEEDKKQIKDLLDSKMGSVGKGVRSLDPKGHDEEVLDLIETLVNSDDRSEIDSAIDEFASLEISGIQSGKISPIFYYLHPEKYPINNTSSREGMEEIFGKEISRQLSDYVDEVEKYKEVKEKSDFAKNYRELDFFLFKGREQQTEIDEDQDQDLYLIKIGDHWRDEFEKTVESPVYAEDRRGSPPPEFGDIEGERIWGTEGGENTFDDMDPDDYLLFYYDDMFFATGKVGRKKKSRDLGDFIWDNEASKYVYTVKDFRHIEIPEDYLWDLLNYKESYYLRAAMNSISDDRMESLFEEYSSIEALIDEYSKSGTGTSYYWVNQTRGVEVEEEFLRAKADNEPSHDLTVLDKGDIIFHYKDQNIIGHSEVVSDARVEEEGNGDYYFVDVDFHRYDEKPSLDQVKDYLMREEVRLDEYYPLNRFGGVNRGYLFSLSDQAGKWLMGGEWGQTQYFWINAEGDWVENQELSFYTSITDKENPRKDEEAFNRAKKGDKVVIFRVSTERKIVGLGTVVEGLHKEKPEDKEDEVPGITIKSDETVDGPSWERISNDSELQDSRVVESNNYGAVLMGLDQEEYDRLVELTKLQIDRIPDNIEVETTELHFPGNKEDEILDQVTTALENGNHVLLVGPPGTGKSKLAKTVCESIENIDYNFVTANSDWSTFDTVGGYHPEKDENLRFKPGVFLDSFKDENGHPQNEWLVIDEINRADIDKAFGSLFSVLAGDDVTLSFTDESDENIQIVSNGDIIQGKEDNIYYVPDDWRMISTMNTLDKTSLYEMSYAFMRRWAFVSVPVPDIPGDNEEAGELVGEYVDVWRDGDTGGTDIDRNREIADIWRIVNKHREIGPAIVEDIYEHVKNSPNPDYASAISMYVIPQLEGLREADLREFVSGLEDSEADINVDRVRDFMEDYFQIDISRN